MSAPTKLERLTIFFLGPKHGQEVKAPVDQKKTVTCGTLNDAKVIDGTSALRTTMIAIAIIAGLITVFAGLVFGGVFGVGAGVGSSALTSLSQAAAFKLMIGGGAVTLAMTALTIAQRCAQHYHQKAPKA